MLIVCTTTSSPTIAGDAAILSPVSVRQATRPVFIETART